MTVLGKTRTALRALTSTDEGAKEVNLGAVQPHVERVLKCVPQRWREVLQRRWGVGPNEGAGFGWESEWSRREPEWCKALNLLEKLAEYEDEHGAALAMDLSDYEICDMAKRLAAEACELDDLAIGQGAELAERIDNIRMLVRTVGVVEDKAINGEPAIKRAQDAKWWRRRLRVHVARVVESGDIAMGLVHMQRGVYVSDAGLQRRQAQVARNAKALEGTLYRNEAGQVYTLRELAELGTANPINRGGELMTRIRGAEEYADARGHVGLFVTLTLPSRYHPVKLLGRRAVPNEKYQAGTTPRDGQLWLRNMWAKARSALARQGVRMYGLRVAEPHHDSTPHWHALVWAEGEAQAQAVEAALRKYWLSDDGDERGAQQARVNIKRMTCGGAAGYVAKYIAKSVGHVALAEHQDLVQGDQLTMDFGKQDAADVREPAQGHQRVDAWAATWGIRQFQTIGMPSVTVWRELRRVSGDQLELFAQEGDRDTVRAHLACHRSGNIRANWRIFMEAMGGHACKRRDWLLRTAHRPIEEGQCNHYGEPLKQGRVVGLVPQRGRMVGHWLVSRRIQWAPVANVAKPAADAGAQDATGDAAEGAAPAPARAALPRAWTGFNNCTARITHKLRRALFGRGDHEPEDWIDPQTLAIARAMSRMQRQGAPA